MKDFDSLNRELLEAGIKTQNFFNKEMSPVETLVNTNVSATPYINILVKYLGILKANELEMVIRALSEKGVKGVSIRLIEILKNKKNYPRLDLWSVGNAISIIDDKSTYDEVLKVCTDKDLGSSRQMMMTTLRNIGTEEAFTILLDSLQDETVRGHAINELGKWGDPKALKVIQATNVRKGQFEEKARKRAIEKLSTSANNEQTPLGFR